MADINKGFDGFDWDDGNIDHCENHGLSIEDIEAVFSGDMFVAPDLAHSNEEERFIAIGRTADRRPVFIAYTHRMKDGKWLIRPVSARYMHDKEIERYEAQSAPDDHG